MNPSAYERKESLHARFASSKIILNESELTATRDHFPALATCYQPVVRSSKCPAFSRVLAIQVAVAFPLTMTTECRERSLLPLPLSLLSLPLITLQPRRKSESLSQKSDANKSLHPALPLLTIFCNFVPPTAISTMQFQITRDARVN